METYVQIIHSMLCNINNCPNGKCKGCKDSVSVSFDSLNLINDETDKMRAKIEGTKKILNQVLRLEGLSRVARATLEKQLEILRER